MDLDLTDEQRLMVETFGAFFAKQSAIDAVRAADGTAGHDSGLWARFCATGGPRLSLPEQSGGGGGTLVDAALVGVEAGRRLAPLAYTDAVVAARLLDRVAGGSWDDLPVGDSLLGWAPAWAGAAQNGDGRLWGRIGWTRNGAASRWLVVDAGSDAVLVDLDGPGVTRRPQPNLARFPMAEIQFDGAVAAGRWPITDDGRGAAVAEARILHAAELVGAGRQALGLARDHVLERRQFDRPIAVFQAIQHRLADRHTALEAAELLVLRAASYAGHADLSFFSAVALLRAAEAAELAAKEALQFFGGYGFTLEYDVHLYLRFAKALAVLARDPAVVDDALPAALRPSQPSGEGAR